MKGLNVLLIIVASILISSICTAQSSEKNKANYVDSENEFYKKTLKDLDEFHSTPLEKKSALKMNFDGIDIPKSINEFSKLKFIFN